MSWNEDYVFLFTYFFGCLLYCLTILRSYSFVFQFNENNNESFPKMTVYIYIYI